MGIYALVHDNVVTQVAVFEGQGAVDWLADNVGGVWVEGLKESGSRAGIGMTNNIVLDAFIPPTPYPSWVLDEATCLWVAPIDYPADGGHVWDEEAGDWVEVTDETV